jgi:hypothetical protein
MKKMLFVIAILGLFAVQAVGQDRTYQFNYPAMYYSLPYRAADSVSSNSSDSTWYFQWVLSEFAWPNKTDVKIKVDELSGTGSCAVSLQGKKFSGDSWSNITTVNYAGGGSDTTFTISDGTARLYRYYRIYVDKVVASAGRSEVESLEVKIWQTQ